MIVTSMKELAAGMEEKVAEFEEGDFTDEQLVKDILTLAAANAGISTLVSTILNVPAAQFSELSKQVVVHILKEYEEVIQKNITTN